MNVRMKEKEILETLKSRFKELFPGFELVELESEFFFQGNVFDAILTIATDGIRFSFFSEIISPSTPKLIFSKLKIIKEISSGNRYPLILGTYISLESQKLLIKEKVSFLDLSGNCYLYVPGRLYVERLGKKNLFPEKIPLKKPFKGKSARIVRSLLEEPDKRWSFRELKTKADLRDNNKLLGSNIYTKKELGISDGQVSKAISWLEDNLYIIRDSQGKVVLKDPDGLLDTWVEYYRFYEKKDKYRFHIQGKSMMEKMERIKSILSSSWRKDIYCFTGLCALSTITKGIVFDIIDLYTTINVDELLKEGFEKDEEYGEVRVSIPSDPGIFSYYVEQSNFMLAGKIQIYLDLMKGAERSRQEGRDFRKRYLLLSNGTAKEHDSDNRFSS